MSGGTATFAALLEARRHDDHAAVLFEDQTWTWRETLEECDRRAGLLQQLLPDPSPDGRRPHIGVLLENVPDFVFWLGAAALTGSVVVGLNSTRRGEALAADIHHTRCDLLVTETGGADLLTEVGDLRGVQVLDVDDPAYAVALAAAGTGERCDAPEPGDTLLLLFSSGSTGLPKAVICSQGRLARLAVALGDRMEIERDTVTYLCMPLFHGNSLMTNLAPVVRAGATVALARRFSASRLVPDLRRYSATYWNFVGRAVAYVLATAPQSDDPDCPLRLAYGTEASAHDAAEFAERFGCRVMQGYGASEGVLRINRVPGTPEGSIGRPVGDSVVVILGEDGRDCAPAELADDGAFLNPGEAIGQMVVRGGAAAFEGYYDNAEAMSDRVHGEDFWTGDLAYRDHDGFLYFAGRTADWLRVDGENIAVAPIERLLERHPAIGQAVVYGVPDPRTGDQVMATLVTSGEAAPDPSEFGSFLNDQPGLGTKWRPRFVRWATNVPTTTNGKVARQELRAQAWLTDDVVWVWTDGDGYGRLDQPRRARLEHEFRTHGRGHLLPQRDGP
jgi:fatty-acyl-CoA synthase